jgi:uncharacterized RmlC-like cupin family protein
MNDTNEQRRTRKTLGKLLALGVAAGAYGLATAGASGLIMAATDMSVQAKTSGHSSGGHASGGRVTGGHARVGHGAADVHGGVHVAGRGRGHFWHGRWYGYGVGPCWRWTPTGYIWICG